MSKKPRTDKNRRDPAVTNEIQKKKVAEQSNIPENEWNFLGGKVAKPPDWQMNHWLNYEYARSFRPMVDAVLEIRAHTPKAREAGTWPVPRGYPRFAAYLARFYPEFPKTPWLELSSDQQGRKQREVIDFEKNPFEDSALTIYDAFDFADDIATGEMTFSRHSFDHEVFAVMKIDYSRGPKKAVKEFEKWLENRRQELLKEFSQSGLIKATSHDNSRVGRGKNRREYEHYLKSLAALRLLKCNPDFEVCFYITEDVLGKGLYSNDQRSWNRPQTVAAELMNRFEIAWKTNYIPAFILMPERFRHASLPQGLEQSLEKEKYNPNSMLAKVLNCFERKRLI